MNPIETLLHKGVRIPNPASVEIGAEVDPARISGHGVVIHAGCKIFGRETLILPGASLGYEAPATVEDCLIGPKVQLKGGYFRQAVFLEGASCGLGAHVRAGTILEEHASIAHTVGLKQTILFPFVTLGSLINFCDCLMAGGTGPRDHSEVGSSYIHFNFTPNQDKATASLLGDVPRGVMLNQRPIFLGGQGGMVGPLRLDFGITVAAGTILRKDELRPNRLIFGGAQRPGNIEFTPGNYPGAGRIIKNNLLYIGNLLALAQWYRGVRSLFVAPEGFPQALLDGLLRTLDRALAERVRRLKDLSAKLAAAENHGLAASWTALEDIISALRENAGDARLADGFKTTMTTAIARTGKDYIRAVQALSPEDSARGTRWLQGVVDDLVAAATGALTAPA